MKAHLKQPTRYTKKVRVKKNDKVLIRVGKFKGQIATITKVDKENDRVHLSGIDPIIRHVKPNQLVPDGKITKARSVHVSNVTLYVEKDGKKIPSKVQINKTDGKRTRVLKKTGTSVEKELENA